MKQLSVAIIALVLAAPAALTQSNPAPAERPVAAASSQMKFYNRQATDMCATYLVGANVKNTQNETVGEINDLVLDKDGKVVAVIVGVGGFLGIGEREVALDYKALNVKYDLNAL